MPRTLSVAALRARLLARGFSVRPICPRCKMERDPGDFSTGECRFCHAGITRTTLALADELGPDGLPKHMPPTGEWEER